MKTIHLGDCCPDCFAAINYNPSEMPHDAAEAAKAAGAKLSKLREFETVHSLHTGQYGGFSWCTCAGCRSDLGGDRWQLVGLKEERMSN